MCGITGFLSTSNNTKADEMQFIVGKMTNSLKHRGPDDCGTWQDSAAGIALGHRRLSVIDLSKEGHQPMHSASSRYVIVYNGEVYNYKVLREKLRGNGHFFRGHSDTEVMLAAFEQWGVENAVKKMIGMFAFVLWDRQEGQLYLARDRIGEKPLYYGWLAGFFIVASEIKALRQHPAWNGNVNRDVLALYLRLNYIPAPYSIYTGIFKLQPGTILTLSKSDINHGRNPEPKSYWSVKQIVEKGNATPFAGTESEAIDSLDELLRDSIRQQMVADVPLGAFLSGGIDSSVIVALMQSQSNQPVNTFSIGFTESNYNEAQYAKAVANHLGTDHTELYVTPEEAMAVIPRLPVLYDEPFADASQIPTFLVSELARNYVTVSLSGDGGDELFGGYNRYVLGRRFWKNIGWIPRSFRILIANLLSYFSTDCWESLFKYINTTSPEFIHFRNPSYKLQKLIQILPTKSAMDMYNVLVSQYDEISDLVVGSANSLPTVIDTPEAWPHISDFTLQMMYLDIMNSLPDDMLAKVDRAAMGVSLETRVPFLDHRVVEHAWRLPLDMKIRNGKGKWILRQVLYKYVPKKLVDRPKMGFGIPINEWLRGPLKDWAEELLDERRLRKENFFSPKPIREKWEEHKSGKHDWQQFIWGVLMFQVWLENQRI